MGVGGRERVADRNMKLTKIRRSSLVETDGGELKFFRFKVMCLWLAQVVDKTGC